MSVIFFATLIFLSSAAAESQSSASVLPDQFINFTILNAGLTVEGKMKVLKGEIVLDAKNPDRSHIFAQADAATISTGILIRDKHLRRSDYFDVSSFPLITMTSKKIALRGSLINVTFDLTIKDVTRHVEVTCMRSRHGKYDRYDGNFEINRLDFKLGEESLILDDFVKIRFSLSAE